MSDGVSMADVYRKNGKFIQFIAILFVILGGFVVFSPDIFAFAIETTVGYAMILAAGFSFVHAFTTRSWKGAIWDTIRVIVYLVIAYMLLINPVEGVVSLELVLAFLFVSDGVTRIIQSFQMRPDSGWAVMLLSGIFSLFIAWIIVVTFPESAPMFISYFVGFSFIFGGASILLSDHL